VQFSDLRDGICRATCFALARLEACISLSLWIKQMHLYLSACGKGPANAVYALSRESAIALLETGCVTCVSFGADWPQGAGCDPAEAIALARYLKRAVAEARLPWVDWDLHCPDVALQRQLTAVLREMDEICRQRGQEIRQDPAEGVAVGLNPDFSFERFVVGEGNEMAYAQAVLAGLGAPTRNVPLWIFGDCGLGKTHLLHALGWQYLAVNPGRRVMLLHGSEFSDPEICRVKLKAADALLIDDIQCLAAIPDTFDWQALFASCTLLGVSADRSVGRTELQHWNTLTTRIEVALVTPGRGLASALLDAFLAEAGHGISAIVRESILTITKSNPRFLQAIVKKIVAYERFEHRAVSSAMLVEWFA
jgi:chromosomal replication initiation ATPase DnaA